MSKRAFRKNIKPFDAVFTGKNQEGQIAMQLISYNEFQYNEKKINDISELGPFKKEGPTIFWLNVHGVHNATQVKELCGFFKLHPLIVQDVLDVQQHFIYNRYESHSFIGLKTLLQRSLGSFESERISLIIGENYIITFQEIQATFFEHIRERIRQGFGQIRERGIDFLLYLLLEALVDNFFDPVQEINNHIDQISLTDLLENNTPELLYDIEKNRRKIFFINQLFYPYKGLIDRLMNEVDPIVKNRHRKYFIDVADLINQIQDSIDRINFKVDSISNLFFSVQGHHLNVIMKTLTIVSAVFIPLTFLAGVYGMNFKYIPELNWHYGYFAVWGAFILIVVILVWFFKKKKWF